MTHPSLIEGDMVVLKSSRLRANPVRFFCAEMVGMRGRYIGRDKYGRLVVQFGGTRRKLAIRDVHWMATIRANEAAE